MDSNDPTLFDVIIIGGGPAGLSASLWCQDLGLSSMLLEKATEFGGQLLSTHNPINNYLGVETTNGRELSNKFVEQALTDRSHYVTSSNILRADLSNKTVELSDGTIFVGKAMVLATGVRRKKLMVPGEEEFCGKGILDSGVRMQNVVQGKVVVIVGGGDAALENAIILSRKADKVYVVHRGTSFRARTEFIETAKSQRNIIFVMHSRVTEIFGSRNVESVEVEDLASDECHRISTDHVLIRIGVEPNSELLREQVRVDSSGYVCITEKCETNLAGVYAIGDLANPLSATVSTAVGNGATAAKAISIYITKIT